MLSFIKRFLSDKQLYRYFVAAGIAATLDLSGFFILTFYFHIHYLIGATISFIAATLLNYLLCIYVVFSTNKMLSSTKLAQTYLVSGLGLTFHHTLLWICIEFAHAPLLLGKLFAMGIVFFWNYLIRKHWVFSSKSFT